MIQKKIVKIMTFKNYSEKSRPLFVALKILNIYELNIYQMSLFMYSYFNGNLPSYFCNYYQKSITRSLNLVLGRVLCLSRVGYF